MQDNQEVPQSAFDTTAPSAEQSEAGVASEADVPTGVKFATELFEAKEKRQRVLKNMRTDWQRASTVAAAMAVTILPPTIKEVVNEKPKVQVLLGLFHHRCNIDCPCPD